MLALSQVASFLQETLKYNNLSAKKVLFHLSPEKKGDTDRAANTLLGIRAPE
jgi:hypothetical protein